MFDKIAPHKLYFTKAISKLHAVFVGSVRVACYLFMNKHSKCPQNVVIILFYNYISNNLRIRWTEDLVKLLFRFSFNF